MKSINGVFQVGTHICKITQSGTAGFFSAGRYHVSCRGFFFRQKASTPMIAAATAARIVGSPAMVASGTG